MFSIRAPNPQTSSTLPGAYWDRGAGSDQAEEDDEAADSIPGMTASLRFSFTMRARRFFIFLLNDEELDTVMHILHGMLVPEVVLKAAKQGYYRLHPKIMAA